MFPEVFIRYFHGFQDTINAFLEVAVPEKVAEVESLCQRGVDIPFRPALADRLNGGLNEFADASFKTGQEYGAFQPRGDGHDDIGKPRAGGMEVFGHGDEVEFFEDLHRPVGVAEELAAKPRREHGFEGIGPAAFYLVDNGIGLHLVVAGSPERELLRADSRGHVLDAFVEGNIVGALCRNGDVPVAAGHIEVAGNRRKQNNGTVVLHAVSMVGGAVGAELELGGPGFSVKPGGFPDFRGRYAGYLLDPLRRVFLHQLFKSVEANRPFIDEVFIVQVFVDDDIHETQCQGAVRTGA